ncbi:hypothetical protein [uncultured Lamprocystis sp.]|jgi:hypothetical protein|uniref:hypothetical protein n=1 Tax=uncultured Lamprocystis sp. TaxID=543132 RepID=UPI0025ECD719|nr:hypothetical protein [uncultured Lamprocystis sp.]
MPNHLYLIAVPSDKDGLRETVAYAHRRYTGYINARLRATGHSRACDNRKQRGGRWAAKNGLKMSKK